MRFFIIPLLLALSAGAAPVKRRVVALPPDPAGIRIIASDAPQFIDSHGTHLLAWELLLHNDRAEEITLRSIETNLATYTGEALRPLILNVPQRSTTTIPAERILAHELAVIFFWEEVKNIPPVITNRVRIASAGGEETLHVPAMFVRLDPPVAIASPLAGTSWLAANGPANDSPHRRALFELDGKLLDAQRFAIDWVKLDSRGSTFTGNPRLNTSYYAYGTDVLAVADGVVSATNDGIPENVPGSPPVVPIDLTTIAGNYIVLDLGNGAFAVYAHLQPRSLRVHVGDRVTRGTPLAKLGNSGNSSEPHLHFHVCNANASILCDGLPYAFAYFATNGVTRFLEIPLRNEVCDF